MGIELFEHNRMAYASAASMLAETGKAAVIHPTGTGKSFIGFKLCEDNPEKKVLWLSPSEYIFKTQQENLQATGAEVPKNISFATYKKFSLLTDEELDQLKPDFLILDEFHRCGAEVWQKNISKFLDKNPALPVLGLSATNIRYLDNQRDMADELFDGNIASEMTLGEAIVRGILAAPKYVMAAFAYQNELDRLQRRIRSHQNKAVRDAAEKYYEALRRALELADGLDVIFEKHMAKKTGKYLVFTSNIEAMRTCMGHVSEWFGKVDPEPHIYSLYTLDRETLKSFDAFKADNDTAHLRLLFCIDALNEGIHVDDIDGVILFRPTISPIVYKQQIGRALAAGKKNAPVIFDIVNNFEGLYSIGSIEEEMRAAITYYNYFGNGEEIVADHFQVIDEVRDCRELFNQLEETLTTSWETMYSHARAYFREHGNLEVPTHYKTPEGYSLGSWLQTQRRIRAGKITGLLDEDRIAMLDELGMRWESVNDLSWQRHYAACRAYREEYGDLNVPGDFVTESGLALGRWIINVRNYRKNGIRGSYFTPEREKLLTDLGMVWSQPDYLWERNYDAAKAYYQAHGDLDVPPGHVENGVKLYNWLADLRKMYGGGAVRRGVLTQEQIAQMDALGMRWESKKDLAFEKGYAYAKAYAAEHGAADAPFGYVTPDGFKLGVFLSKCREKYAKGKLTAEEQARLEEIHMVWSKSRKNDWDDCFEAVRAYYEAHGDLALPADYTAGGVWLNKWLNEQKQILLGNRKGKTLTEEQRRKLASIGFTGTDPRETKWDEKYAELQEYYAAHGHCRLPVNYTDSAGQRLYIWLVNQKRSARSGKMSEERKNRLRAVGAL